jgi:hypothetical protein
MKDEVKAEGMKNEVKVEGMKDEVTAGQLSLHPYRVHSLTALQRSPHNRLHLPTAFTSSFILHPFIRESGAD